jgi:hypothetical protein
LASVICCRDIRFFDVSVLPSNRSMNRMLNRSRQLIGNQIENNAAVA